MGTDVRSTIDLRGAGLCGTRIVCCAVRVRSHGCGADDLRCTDDLCCAINLCGAVDVCGANNLCGSRSDISFHSFHNIRCSCSRSCGGTCLPAIGERICACGHG